jgi:RimJ/RimL family protein N-acetyltransferase
LTVLITANLTLRPCSPEDSADFISLERDPDVMRFLNGGKAVDQTVSDPNAPFLMPRGTEPYVWTARTTDSNAFAGWFCLWPESETIAELGYRLARNQWGKGFASQGAAALVEWGFTACHYDKIFASALTTNHASRRVMEKLGMTYVKTIHPDLVSFAGSEAGEALYEVNRET